MAIRRGVSSYSYQNDIFNLKMYWNDFIRVIREDLDTDGVELIDETFIRDYPFMSREFEAAWNNEIARYNMKSVTMDIYLDVLQFRDHVMNHAEAVERLKRDLKIAARLGFQNVRALAPCPEDVIEACIPIAEDLGVCIGQEVHAPIQIVYDAATDRNPKGVVDAQLVDTIIEMRLKHNTTAVALVPDMGLFNVGITPSQVAQAKRQTGQTELIDWIVENRSIMTPDELTAKLKEKCPDANLFAFGRLIQPQASAKPEELLKIIPYTCSIHGKFYEMVEDPTKPGGYYDPSIPYDEIMKYLIQGGFDGYINSEFEGQGYRNDLPDEEMFDEREQVRRQHVMLKALGAV